MIYKIYILKKCTIMYKRTITMKKCTEKIYYNFNLITTVR